MLSTSKEKAHDLQRQMHEPFKSDLREQSASIR